MMDKRFNKPMPKIMQLDEPKVYYGAASLTNVVCGIDFPISKSEIVDKYGSKMVNYSKSNMKTISEILNKATLESFTNMSEFVEACSRRS